MDRDYLGQAALSSELRAEAIRNRTAVWWILATRHLGYILRLRTAAALERRRWNACLRAAGR